MRRRVSLIAFAGRVQVLAEVSGAVAGLGQFGVERVVEFAGEHLLFFGGHAITKGEPFV